MAKYIEFGLAGLLLAFIAYLVITKSILQGDLSDSQRDLSALTIANKEYYLAEQQASQREAEALKKLEAATKMANEMDVATSVVAKQKPMGADDCAATVALVNKYVVGK